MKLKTKWIVSDPLEPGGSAPYSGLDDNEIIQAFHHFHPNSEILFMSEDRNEARAFYDGLSQNGRNNDGKHN